MSNFKKFMAVFLSAVVLGTVLTAGTLRFLYARSEQEEQSNATINGGKHFSVKWMGFKPSYSNQTPDYYICINNLSASSLTMNVAMQIQNFEPVGYFFSIEPYTAPPAGWTVGAYHVGYIGVDQTLAFTYSSLARSKPASIPSGRVTESIDLVTKAYYDASYSTVYSQANFTVRFHFIDRTAPSWTVLYYDNFDDGTSQGWSGASGSVVYYTQYRSWPCSYSFYGGYSGQGAYKTFTTTGPYTETYLVFSVRPTFTGDFYITFNGQLVFQTDKSNTVTNTWYQIAVSLPISLSTQVKIFSTTSSYTTYLDDIYVIGK